MESITKIIRHYNDESEMLISKTSYNVIWGLGRFVGDGSKDISFTVQH